MRKVETFPRVVVGINGIVEDELSKDQVEEGTKLGIGEGAKEDGG